MNQEDIFREARENLCMLCKSDIVEMKSFSRPPVLVEEVMNAILVLLGIEPNWKNAKKVLSNFL